MAKFKDPIDAEADLAEGTKRSMERFEENLDGAPKEVVVEDPPDPDDPDDELDRAEPGRRDRRTDRSQNYRTMRERAAANEARADAYKEQLDRLATQPQQAHQPPAPAVAPTAELEAKRDKIQADYERLSQEYNTRFTAYQRNKQNMPAAEDAEFRSRAKELEQEKVWVLQDIREAKLAPQRQQEENARMYRARAPDVFQNPRASQWAGSYFSQKMAENPNSNAEQLFEEAVAGARRVVLGQRPPPDQGQRQRATGASRGAMPSSSPSRASIQMTAGQLKMAQAAYPKLSAKEAAQKWANRNGKELLELERQAGR